MSAVEVLNELKLHRAKGVEVVCVHGACVRIYDVEVELVWDNGLLSEVILRGVDEQGRRRVFRKTFVWSSEGYLQSVSQWEEVG